MKAIRYVAAAGIIAIAGCVCGLHEGDVAYVDEFDLSAASCGYGKQVKALEGRRGIYTHPESGVAFRLNGRVKAFDAVVGLCEGAKAPYKSYGRPYARFRVWTDGRIAWASPSMPAGEKPVSVHVDLDGVNEVVLETASGGRWCDFPGADCNWLDARFTCGDGALIESVTDRVAFAQLGILTPEEKPEPQFNGADIWGVRPGHEVIFRVPVSGKRPMKFTAAYLPEGVTLDERGVLRGVAPAKKGDYDIPITAENAFGRVTKVIRLAVGDVISRTPPMGWNSWNVWCYGITAERAKASALAMEKSGLGDYGWAYVNLDDWWEMNNSGCPRIELRRKELGREDVIGPARDADGRILPNRSFPDMKGLTDYIHSFGFKAGIYSSPGPITCGKCEGSYGHEELDASSWAEWGFDYIKYDWCSYTDIVKDEFGGKGWWSKDESKVLKRGAFKEKPYYLMRDCLRKQNRDIVYSFCQYGMGSTHLWGRDAGAQCWRTWDDLKDGWTWMECAIDSRINGEFWKWCGKGFWPDTDMMIIGRQRSYGYDHMTFLTPNEQYAHVSIWAMLSAPLLTGCDLTELDPFTRSLLVNREVIAISQDRLGEVARRCRHTDGESVWMKRLADGDIAIALLNRSPVARTIAIRLDELGIDSGRWQVRDCWTQTNEERITERYSAKVPPHAVKLIRLSVVKCQKCD